MPVIFSIILVMLTGLVAHAAQEPAPAAPSLGRWRIDRNSISISGVSSGGFMAVQMGVAYSQKFSAVASIAGGIYWCSEGDTHKAKSLCMGNPESIDPQVRVAKARALADGGEIDPVIGLQRQRIYIFASPKDKVINPLNSAKLGEFYSAFVPSAQISLESSLESAHGFPTLSSGIPCQFAYLPWLLKCNFDLAGEILKSAYGSLQPRGVFQSQHLLRFSQQEFGNENTPLFKEGWVYVPQECAQGVTCRLHVALHGCQMNPDFIQDKFVTLAGYNEWAETNRIVVLYPQSAKISDDNPYACWDWFGFTGPQYMTRSGTQMKALHFMIERAIQ